MFCWVLFFHVFCALSFRSSHLGSVIERLRSVVWTAVSLSSLCPSRSREAWPWQETVCGYLLGSYTIFGRTNWCRLAGRRSVRALPAVSGEVKNDGTVTTAVAVSSAAELSKTPAKCVGLHWESSPNEEGPPHRQLQSAPWITSSLAPPPPPDRSSTPMTPPVRLPPGIQSPLASDADDSLAGVRAVDCPMRLRIDDVFSCYREDDSDWFDAWRHHQSSPAIRELTLKAHLYPRHELKPNHSLTVQRPYTQSALLPGRDNRRCSDRLQILSCDPGPARGSDPRALASHLNGPWHVVCVQEEAGWVTDRSLAENFYVITKHHCAVLIHKETFETGYTCTPIQVPCAHRYYSWALSSPASSADLPTKRASTLLLQTCTSTTSAPNADLFASLSCASQRLQHRFGARTSLQ